MNFSERLKELRTEYQYTQRQLANFLGLSPNSICEWEKNRSEPNIETLLKLSNYFEVSVDYLLGVEDDFGARVAAPMSAPTSYSSEERELIEKYRELNAPGKKLINTTINTLLNSSAKSGHNKITYED